MPDRCEPDPLDHCPTCGGDTDVEVLADALGHVARSLVDHNRELAARLEQAHQDNLDAAGVKIELVAEAAAALQELKVRNELRDSVAPIAREALIRMIRRAWLAGFYEVSLSPECDADAFAERAAAEWPEARAEQRR